MEDGSGTGAPRADQEQRDYAGAIYGSLLAASVVAGTSPGREPPHPGELIVLLLATGVVFWLAHVYAGVVGERSQGTYMSRAEFRAVAGREWPLVQATVPPAAAAGIGALIGLSDSTRMGRVRRRQGRCHLARHGGLRDRLPLPRAADRRAEGVPVALVVRQG